jgi:hypothetical protein
MPTYDATRREFLRAGAAAVGAGFLGGGAFTPRAVGQDPGPRPRKLQGVEVLNPLGRVPVSLIIDDSTCLVNLAHFAIPQFAQVFPNQYRQPWKTLPREIPDGFVRTFGEWCHEHGVKGKYSVVPYPACVGWLDRDLPGWSRQELTDSLDLVRNVMAPDWDIHPEMVSHTWVVDTKTGRPFPEKSDKFMENWRWTDGKSVDQLADYLTYALRILKNVGLPCEGITTPGGFGNRVLPELAQASQQALRDVFSAEIPHYFRHLFTDDRSVAPRVEYASGLDGPDPKCVVSMIGCTGDWFGGWDGLTPGRVDQFITEDGKAGRLPQVIARGEPAVLVCHWPGMYFNGQEVGFRIFREVVKRLHSTYDHLVWMKLGEIARYWAAKELTRFERGASQPGEVVFDAPFACPKFTVRVTDASNNPAGVSWQSGTATVPLRPVKRMSDLAPGTFFLEGNGGRALVACVNLAKGRSTLLA